GRHRARGAGGLDPDHAARAVRVLHPLSRGAGPGLPAPAAAPDPLAGDPLMKPSMKFGLAMLAVTLVMALAATALLLAATPALAADAAAGGAAVGGDVWRWGLAAAAASTALAAL